MVKHLMLAAAVAALTFAPAPRPFASPGAPVAEEPFCPFTIPPICQ
jgi:hypothetical protein